MCLVVAFSMCDAHAQDFAAARACTRLSDNAARLACYDAAFGLVESPGGKLQNEHPSGAVKSDPVAKFGDNGQLHHESKADVPKSLTGQVEQVAALANSLYRLTLNNGQIWQTTQANWTVDFKAGDTVTISRLPLGGYQISLAGQNQSCSAKRVK